MSTATAAAPALPVSRLSSLPAPRAVGGFPLLGALPSMLRDGPGTMLAAARAHPDEVFALKLGPVQVPVVYKPEHLQQVLIDDARSYTKAGMWQATRPLLGEGLVTSDGDVWKRQRQLMQPLFTPRYVAGLGGLMVNAIDAQIQDMLGRAGSPMEAGAEMTQITQRVLMDTMFGGSLDRTQSVVLADHLITAFQAMNVRIFTYYLPEWFPRPGGRAFFRSVAAIDEAMLSLVARRRQEPGGHRDMLSLLIEARDPETGAPLADREIRDQLVTLFVAGLDTTAVMLTWLFYLLDQHPDVEARLRAEIASVVGDRLPTGEDVAQLSYTRQVVQETMRLYPPAWIFPRYTAQGAEVGGRRIAPGASMLVSSWLTHRDPQHWDRPDTFDPDRFSPERTGARHRLAYVPFGAGGRMCIGSHFAMMEGILATVMLLQRFRGSVLPGQRVSAAAASTLKPKGGLYMKFQPVV